MTPDDLPTDSPLDGDDEAAAALRRRRRRLGLGGVALVLVGAAGSFAISAWSTPPEAPREAGVADEGEPPARLAPHATPAKPVPAGTVEVEVVERGTDAPVPEVDVRLRRELSEDDPDAPAAVTDASGRARLRGPLPAFVELESDVWTSDPRRLPADEKTTLRIEVVPRTPFRVRLADEATGLPVPGWTIGCVDGEATAATRADDHGVAEFPRRRRPPELLAATDGRRRVHVFLLTAFPGRDDARLELPAAERATTLRALDENGAPVAGAVVAIGGPGTGVSVPCDERGEATLEYGLRTAVPVVVSAPGRASRALRLDGAPSVTVTLLPTASRRFRVRAADGARVPDGSRLRVFTRGPAAYGPEGAGRTFAAAVADEAALVPGLPAGAFEALVLVEGPGADDAARISTLARVRAGDDAVATIDLVVGPGRRFTLGKIPGEADGAPPTAIVRVDGRAACASDVREEARDLVETFALGRAVDALGACFVVRGPDAEILLPRSTEPRRVEVLTAGGALACLVVGPDDDGGARTLAFADARTPPEPEPTTLRVEWAEGGIAQTLALEVRRDERGADVVPAFTDSSGIAVVRLAPGRYVVEAETAAGVRYAGDAPLLVPSTGVAPVRLRALAR